MAQSSEGRAGAVEPPAPASRARPRTWRRRLLALALGYALVELIVMPVVAARAPLRMRARFPAPMYILGQPTKHELRPHDYVLVVGDSYAEGYGDWLWSALPKAGNPPFQSTDVLHRLTGRDVLNVGRGGAGSVSGMVYLVEKRFAALRRMGLEDPSDVVMYFYEGNDLSDNLGEVARHCGHSGRTGATCSEAELDAWIASRGRDGFWAGVPGAFLAPYLLIQAVRGRATGMQARGDRVGLGPAPDAAGTDFEQMLGSRIRVGGVDHCFSAGAEGPGLGLCEGEVELGLRLLDRSIAWIQRRFSGARFTLVYLPAPLTCYPIESDEVRSKPACVDGGTLHPRASVREQSSAMRGRVASIAAARGAGFLDVTPAFCAAGKTTLLHGPADAEHFNEAGYTLLGELLAEELLREPGPAASRGL